MKKFFILGSVFFCSNINLIISTLKGHINDVHVIAHSLIILLTNKMEKLVRWSHWHSMVSPSIAPTL